MVKFIPTFDVPVRVGLTDPIQLHSIGSIGTLTTLEPCTDHVNYKSAWEAGIAPVSNFDQIPESYMQKTKLNKQRSVANAKSANGETNVGHQAKSLNHANEEAAARRSQSSFEFRESRAAPLKPPTASESVGVEGTKQGVANLSQKCR